MASERCSPPRLPFLAPFFQIPRIDSLAKTMSIPIKPSLTASILLLATLHLVGCGDQGTDQVLKLGHSLPTSHPVHKALEQMALQVQQASQGTLRMDIYPNEQLGSEREMVEQVQLGSLHLVKTSASPLEGFIPEIGVFTVPYLFDDAAHLWETLEGEIGRELLDSGKGKGLIGLCYYDAGSRSFYTKERPIDRPGDLEGLKIRVQNSKTAMQMVEAMGGAPTPIAFGELYTSLEQGVVDGAENNPPSFLSSRHYEVCKFYGLDEHSSVPDVVLVSEAAWNRLTEAQQDIIRQAANDAAMFQRELWQQETKRALETLEAEGVEISRPDKAPFRASVQALHESYRNTPVGDLIARIRQLRTAPSE